MSTSSKCTFSLSFPPELCTHFPSPTYVPHARLTYCASFHLPSNLSTYTIPTRMHSNDSPTSFDTICGCKHTLTFKSTDLCLGINGGVWGRKWVRDTEQQQAIWPIRTTESLKARRTSFQANRNGETSKLATRIMLSWHVR